MGRIEEPFRASDINLIGSSRVGGRMNDGVHAAHRVVKAPAGGEVGLYPFHPVHTRGFRAPAGATNADTCSPSRNNHLVPERAACAGDKHFHASASLVEQASGQS
jgi:hypothetical protein